MLAEHFPSDFGRMMACHWAGGHTASSLCIVTKNREAEDLMFWKAILHLLFILASLLLLVLLRLLLLFPPLTASCSPLSTTNSKNRGHLSYLGGSQT